jgi:hypothetical protein
MIEQFSLGGIGAYEDEWRRTHKCVQLSLAEGFEVHWNFDPDLRIRPWSQMRHERSGELGPKVAGCRFECLTRRLKIDILADKEVKGRYAHLVVQVANHNPDDNCDRLLHRGKQGPEIILDETFH